MKKVSFENAIGQKLAHDICEIISEKKHVAFKRGHVVTSDDKDYLQRLGKNNFYVLDENDTDLIHEEDAASIIFETINDGSFYQSAISMGKISFLAKKDGFFTVNKELLTNFNLLGDISCGCIANMTYVKKGCEVASVRIIPLFTTSAHITAIKSFANAQNIFSILDIQNTNIHQITTGSEVAKGIIKDAFHSKLNSKLATFNLAINNYVIVEDNKELIINQIKNSIDQNAHLILITGGMSVDPDDLTPGAIKDVGANIITYGTPIIPGSMFLYSVLNDTPLLGLPGAVIFEEKTAFDLLLPYALTNKQITTKQIMEMSVGGLLNG